MQDDDLEAIILPNKEGLKFLCYLPKVTKPKDLTPVGQHNSSSVGMEIEKKLNLKTPDELLDGLNNICLLRVSNYGLLEVFLNFLESCRTGIYLTGLSGDLNEFTLSDDIFLWSLPFLVIYSYYYFVQQEGWWTYEFCFKKALRQVHLEDGKVILKSCQLSMLVLYGYSFQSFSVDILY